MMVKDIKRTYFNFLPYECAAAEEYLEKMAMKGWLLEAIKGKFLKFKKIESKKIKYSVDVLNKVSAFDHKDSDVALEYREYCKAAGWNYACETGKIQIFYTEDEQEAISIHTDAGEKFKAVYKASIYPIGMQVILALLFMFNLYVQIFMGGIAYTLASNLGITSSVLMIYIIVINGIYTISFFLWVIRARIQLKENKFMPYNNYKQLRIKQILTTIYISITFLIGLGLLILDNFEVKSSNAFLLIIILIPITIMTSVQWFINKKSYSKKTNMAIYIISTVVSIWLLTSSIGFVALSGITKTHESENLDAKMNLSLMDFGYKDDKKDNPYIFNKSVLAQRGYYSYENEEKQLTYTIFESQYSWVVNLYKNRLINVLIKWDNDLKLENTNLPDNIKVYSDSKKSCFVLVSENKVIDIRNEFKDISEDEFLDKAYKKLLE